MEPIGPETGLKFVASPPPETRRIGAVSPITRATPRMMAVTKPLFTAGTTTIATVRHWVAPKANPASRKSFGISSNTSSAVLATVGIIRIESARAPIKPVRSSVIG